MNVKMCLETTNKENKTNIKHNLEGVCSRNCSLDSNLRSSLYEIDFDKCKPAKLIGWTCMSVVIIK